MYTTNLSSNSSSYFELWFYVDVVGKMCPCDEFNSILSNLETIKNLNKLHLRTRTSEKEWKFCCYSCSFDGKKASKSYEFDFYSRVENFSLIFKKLFLLFFLLLGGFWEIFLIPHTTRVSHFTGIVNNVDNKQLFSSKWKTPN